MVDLRKTFMSELQLSKDFNGELMLTTWFTETFYEFRDSVAEQFT